MLGSCRLEVQSRLDAPSFYFGSGPTPMGAGAGAHLSTSSPGKWPQNPRNTCHSRDLVNIDSFPSLYFGCLM